MCSNLGSGSGGGGSSGSKYLPEELSSTVMGRTIKGNSIYSEKGKYLTSIDSAREIREIDDNKKARDLAKEAGIEDAVIVGRALIPRKVAEAAIEQGRKQRENYEHNMKTNVKGYDELTNAIAERRSEYRKQRTSIEEGDFLYRAKDTGVAALAKKYPRAAAYIKAESYNDSRNYEKSSLGKEAMEAIRMGKPYKKAISDMEKKWHKYTEKEIWNN